MNDILTTNINKSQLGVGDSCIDVYQDYTWYYDTDEKNKDRIPYVELIEYKNNTDLVLQKLLYLRRGRLDADQIRESIQSYPSFEQIYKNLYQIEPTGVNIRLPYFGRHPFTIQTTYSEIDPTKSDNIGDDIMKTLTNLNNAQLHLGDSWDTIRQVIERTETFESTMEDYQRRLNFGEEANSDREKRFRRRAGVTKSANSIKTWQSANTGQYETSFVLYNKKQEDIQRNYIFIMQMMKKLAPSYLNTMMVNVPYLYTIIIPSVLTIPLGFIGNFSATPKGVSYISKDGVIVPDAWEVAFTFNSLFPISKQMLDEIEVGDFQTKAAGAFTKNVDRAPRAYQTGDLSDYENYYDSAPSFSDAAYDRPMIA